MADGKRDVVVRVWLEQILVHDSSRCDYPGDLALYKAIAWFANLIANRNMQACFD